MSVYYIKCTVLKILFTLKTVFIEIIIKKIKTFVQQHKIRSSNSSKSVFFSYTDNF